MSPEQQLRNWFSTSLGRVLARMEVRELDSELVRIRGHQLVQVGDVLPDGPALDLASVRHRVRMQASLPGESLVGRGDALPFQADSVDALVMPHALELTTDPHQVLREAQRVLTPEGHLVLTGFQPWSLAGIAKLMRSRRNMPWSPRWLAAGRIKDWLTLLGFEPQVHRPAWVQSTARALRIDAERIPAVLDGRPLHSFAAGIYVLVARKRVIWIRPVVSRWRRAPRLVPVGLAEPAARAQRDSNAGE